jgi:hypothetical protein
VDTATETDPYVAMDYFELPERRVPLNFRVPETLKLHLQAVVRLWKLMAKARGKDAAFLKSIDMTHVCERLLKVGVDGVWAKAGEMAGLQGMPTSEDDWDALERAILKAAKEDARSRK